MNKIYGLTVAFFTFLSCLFAGLSADSGEGMAELRDFFENNGYLVVKDFFSEEQASELSGWADKMGEYSRETLATKEREEAYRDSLIVVPESGDPQQVCRVEDILSFDDKFQEVVQNTVAPFLEGLFGESYLPFKDKLNFKWPGGGAFGAHQDFPAYQQFQPQHHVTAMISIDEATEENGYLFFAHAWRESMKERLDIDQDALAKGRAILPHHTGGKNNGDITEEVAKEFDWKGMHTTPRDLVLFSSFLPHYSKKNASPLPRRAMFITYNREAEGEHKLAYYEAKRNDPHNPLFHFATPTE